MYKSENHPIYIKIITNENGEIASVQRANSNDENKFPLIFKDMSAEGSIDDEFHRFCLILEKNICVAVCYSSEVAEQFCEFYYLVENRKLDYLEVPYENPTLLGQDDYSCHLRVIDYLEDFENGHEPDCLSAKENANFAFLKYAESREKEIHYFLHLAELS